jgi:dTDP-4-dehydrorhamnose reductase
LGTELLGSAPGDWTISAHDVGTADITLSDQVSELLDRERPALVINAAAYTAVDTAESEPEAAARINAVAPRYLAEKARMIGARLIHLSTDFVFDGLTGHPYTPGAPTAPLGVYGRTKLEGERAVLESGGDVLVLRTAWLYGAHGQNFVLTMLRLMRERESIGVVADQVGSPTWARSLALAIWAAASRPTVQGLHHWTDAGVASWYDFAVAIQEEALLLGLLRRSIPVRPIRTQEYVTPARRPAYSVLEKSQTWEALGMTAEHWRVNLRRMLKGLARA